jgi:agmatine deiminase
VYFVSGLDKKDDMTGYIDGCLRFVDNKTIVVNRLADEETFWQRSFYEMITASGLSYFEMPWFTPSLKTLDESAIGSYVNYLHLDNLIIFPNFDCEGNKDAEALKVIYNLFPNHNIEPVIINDIAEEGGLMNCITWTY